MSDGSGSARGIANADFSAADLSPGSARLRGTIVAVNRDALSADATSPCGRYPCTATVRVDSVYGYGAGFPSPMAPGEEFVATFEFTLGPTKELFPGMQESYPGLDAGSVFDADIIYMQRPGRNADPRRDGSLTVYDYRRLL